MCKINCLKELFVFHIGILLAENTRNSGVTIVLTGEQVSKYTVSPLRLQEKKRAGI